MWCPRLARHSRPFVSWERFSSEVTAYPQVRSEEESLPWAQRDVDAVAGWNCVNVLDGGARADEAALADVTKSHRFETCGGELQGTLPLPDFLRGLEIRLVGAEAPSACGVRDNFRDIVVAFTHLRDGDADVG